MCKYCEEIDGYMETYEDPNSDIMDVPIKGYLMNYSDGSWYMVISQGDASLEMLIDNCPWCGRELY